MAAVTETLKPLPGVADVQVDFPNRIASLQVDPEVFDAAAAIAKLDEANYQGSKQMK